MTLDEKLIAMEQRLRALVMQRTANLVQVSPVKLATSDGLTDGLDGRPADQSYQRETHRFQHAGFRSRPPIEAQAVMLLVEGGASKAITVAEDDGQGANVPLDAGEAKVYSPTKPACRIWLDKNGVLHIDADAGQDVVVNGGTAKVGRVGDATDNGTWSHTPASGVGVTPCVLVYTPPGGAPTTITPAGVAVTGKINAGAAHFKG